MSLADAVRRSCAEAAERAQQVRIDTAALREVQPGPPPALDPERHPLELSEADLATYLLTVGAINYGSGWFPTLRKRQAAGRPVSGYFTVAWALADHFRAHGPWTNAQLRLRHGLQRFTVRGLGKVTSVMLLLAVTHNLLRCVALLG